MSSTNPPAKQFVKATLVDGSGVRREAGIEDVRLRKSAGAFFWFDIWEKETSSAAELLKALDLDDAETRFLQRCGEPTCLEIGPGGIRAITWVATTLRDLSVIRLTSIQGGIVSCRTGDQNTLDHVHQAFAERVGGLDTQPFFAGAILLQLLLGTIDRVLSAVDERTQQTRDQVLNRPGSINAAELNRWVNTMRSSWLYIEQYACAARVATIGIEAIPVIGPQGVRELNEFQKQVERMENQLRQRFQETSDIVRSYQTILAQRQGEQIDRLTIVSIIFLPITFLTGFFGMNFNWMLDLISNELAFIILGILLPVVCVTITLVWLRRRGLL